MGIISSNKLVDKTAISCAEQAKVTLALTAAPDIITNPTDIALVLDRSGSMRGTPIASLKTGAKKFIEIIDEATDTAQDGNIGSGSHIGIVSFATTAVQDTALITSVAELNAAVDGLTASGDTNHADAFRKARELFDPASTNNKVIVIFTDGETTVGGPALPEAEAAKAEGITIYCIGLVGLDGIDVATLNAWATDPDSAHVAVTPDDQDLEQLFQDLAENITKAGATNILIDETVTEEFQIVNIISPAYGSVIQTSPTNLQWTIDQLGTTSTESAVLEFYIEYVGDLSGEQPVNAGITYQDAEGNQVTFPTPNLTVNCIAPYIEDCPIPVNLTMVGCDEFMAFDAGAISLESTGCVLELSLTIQDVCPDKRVALAMILTEIDAEGLSQPRGMKTITIPAHTLPVCTDIQVQCVRFVLPADLLNTDAPMCAPRDFQLRMIANYLDNDFRCCEL